MNERYVLNKNLAQMLKGGVIMDVTNAAEAIIAEKAGACAVMALERVPADIRKAGGVARMSDPKMILEIQESVSIPVMAKVRIGHFVEAQILEAIEIDYIDESEVLSPADDKYHINKLKFNVPFSDLLLVYNEKTKRFIFDNPAGSEIYCLTTGINLPKKVEICPCLEKNSSILKIVSSFIKKYFPYFNKKTLPSFRAK